MRILVTGGAGFIGSSLCERLASLGHAVEIIDNFNDYYSPLVKRQNLFDLIQKKNVHLTEGDICDPQILNECFARSKPDRVVHLAAWAGVRPSIEKPLLYQRVNVEGTAAILEACRTHGVRHVIFASSSSVYGDREQVPFCEDDNVDFPISPYAASKKAGELLCHVWHHLYGLNIYALRFFTVYGPRQRPDLAIHHFAKQMMAGLPCVLYGDGSTSRDYTYIDDITDGILSAIDRVNGFEIVNLGNSTPTRLDQLVLMLGEAMGITPEIRFEPTKPGDVTRTFASTAKASRLLDYHPKVSMQEGLSRFAEWFKAGQGLADHTGKA